MSLLECKNLTKNYGHHVALYNMNLSLTSGKIVGLLGPNGSGKTTLIKMANGLLQPTGGEILIDGNKPGVETKSVVAYLPDREVLPDYYTIKKLIGFYSDFFKDFNRTKAHAMLDNLNLNLDSKIKILSKGNREKVQLILTMSRDAKVYFLDEPIAGVDPAARDYILKTIIGNYSENALVIISTHLISDVESILEEAVFINEGNIILHKSVDDIREEDGKSVDQLFREVFRC